MQVYQVITLTFVHPRLDYLNIKIRKTNNKKTDIIIPFCTYKPLNGRWNVEVSKIPLFSYFKHI